jgi:large subunit ribosomal protein L22
MKSYLYSVRIAPKKANLIAKMVRGLPVPDAVEQLRLTHKKGARIIEQVLRAAIANASHNDRQDPQTMVVKTIIVNQGMAYRRGMPKARGQQRPFRKFLSHIELELGFPEEKKEKVTKGTKATKGAKVEKTDAPKKKTTTKKSASATSAS